MPSLGMDHFGWLEEQGLPIRMMEQIGQLFPIHLVLLILSSGMASVGLLQENLLHILLMGLAGLNLPLGQLSFQLV